jgi:aminopeptidase N
MVEVRLGFEKRPARVLGRASARVMAAFIAATALLAYGGDAGAGRFDFDATPGRLPKHVVPSHYALEFELDPASDAFTGRAEIELEIRRSASEIVLQANELQAISATLVSAAGTERSLSVTPDPAQQLWRLNWEPRDPLAPGRWRLRIHYQGKVERRGQGLFVVEYRTGAASEAPQRMLATQLEMRHIVWRSRSLSWPSA